jgi:hypothetical protein
LWIRVRLICTLHLLGCFSGVETVAGLRIHRSGAIRLGRSDPGSQASGALFRALAGTKRAAHLEKGSAMIVEVVGGAEERPEARVVDVDNLSRLHLALGEVTDEEASDVLETAGLGRILDADTAYLDAAALRTAAEVRATAPDWADRWEAMVAGAREKGWLSEDGARIQVHVESAAGG